jgi:Leucine-rich repeat (LRR) protein
MEQLTEMVDFEISFNRLQAFDVDILKWKKLNKLHLMYNNISRYNEKALWGHQNVAGVDIRDNVGLNMPDGNMKISMPSLHYIHLGNNSQSIHAVRFDSASFPVLLYLYLNGNELLSLPDESLKDSLIDLGMARCRLNSLPVYLSRFHSLKYLDVRDNNISMVDTQIKKLIHDNKIESYFAGNSVCNRDTELDCTPLCSKYCWSRTESSNGRCAATCNSEQCEYDGGDGRMKDVTCF